MAIKSDRWIREMVLARRMIEPFTERQISKGKISYGLSSYVHDGQQYIMLQTGPKLTAMALAEY